MKFRNLHVGWLLVIIASIGVTLWVYDGDIGRGSGNRFPGLLLTLALISIVGGVKWLFDQWRGRR